VGVEGGVFLTATELKEAILKDKPGALGNAVADGVVKA